jgi:hypothetical protein
MDLSEFGLNHGVELDEEATLGDDIVEVKSLPDVAVMDELTAHDIFKEVVPGEVPELKDDLRIIAAESACLEDLQYVLADLKKVGGMNQSFAQEAKRLYPEFDGNKHLNYYSKSPTLTRYKPAMESLWDKLKSTFADLIRRIREMIRRFVLWLVGSRDPNEKLMSKSNEQILAEVTQSAKQQEYRADEIVKDLEELKSLASAAVKEIKRGVELKDQHGQSQHVSDFDKLVAHYLYDTEASDEVRQFMEGRNPIFHDIVDNGPWSQATEALVDTMEQALSVMNQKATALSGVLANKGSTSFADQLIAGRTLDVLNQRVQVSFQGRQMNLQDVASNYNHIYLQASEGEPHLALSFEMVFASMAQALSTGPTKKLIETGRDVAFRLLTIEKWLDLLEVGIGNILTDGAEDMPEHSMASEMREALDSVRQDVRDLSMIANRMNAYRSIVETMAARVTGFAYRLAVAIYRDLEVSSHDSKAPEAIQALAKQAERMRQRHAASAVKNLFKAS